MGYGNYSKGYAKPTEATERVWAVYLADEFIVTARAAAQFWQELNEPHAKVSRKTFKNFVIAFNQLYSDTHMHVLKAKSRKTDEDEKAEKFLEDLKKKFFAKAREKRFMWDPKKDEQLFKLYEDYCYYNELLHQSPLMRLIEEANIMKDSGN
jgi:hypothetical protein